MKKLIGAIAVVVMAACAQAATITWNTGILYSVDKDGKWTSTQAYGDTNIKSLQLTATLYDATGTLLETQTKTYSDINTMTKGISSAFAYTATTSTGYKLALTGTADFGNGTQTFLNTDPVAFTTKANGNTTASLGTSGTGLGIINTSATQWSAAPEPTSGLLLLIGMAGLALRRRRA